MSTSWLPEAPVDATQKKAARREARRLRKHEEDARRRLDAWERYRAMWDAVDFKRKLVDIGDTKARLALTIMGALNAAVFYVLLRGASTLAMPHALLPWFVGLLVVYGVVTFGFVVQTIEALRPRTEQRARVLSELRLGENGEGTPDMPTSLGLFLSAGHPPFSLQDELRLWSSVSATVIATELVTLNRSATAALEHQFTALAKVYRGLKLLVVLAATMLVLVGLVWCFRPGG